MVVSLIAGGVSYSVPAIRKITYVTGLSAQGKSWFFRQALIAKSVGAGITGVVPSRLLLPSGDSESVAAAIRGADFDVCVIDVDETGLSGGTAAAINSKAAKFILVGRDVSSRVPVHYLSVLAFVAEGRGHVARSVYADKVTKGIDFSRVVVVEDSGGGFEFYRNRCIALGHKNIKSANGFGNLPRLINELTGLGRRVQLIADAATFGCVVGDIKDLSGVLCFLPECTEQVFLSCPMFDQSYKARLPEELLRYASSERYYERELARQLSLTHKKYEKGRLHRCLGASCERCGKGSEALCPLFSYYERPEAIWQSLYGQPYSTWSAGVKQSAPAVAESGALKKLNKRQQAFIASHTAATSVAGYARALKVSLSTARSDLAELASLHFVHVKKNGSRYEFYKKEG